MKILAALALAAASASGQTPPQFDLDCSKATTDPFPYAVQANVHFRFDLSAKKWCEGDCGEVHDILEVQPTVIWLDKPDPDLAPPGAIEAKLELLHFRKIDRESGEYIYSKAHWTEQASCERLPFSGFPHPHTRF